MRKAIAKRLTSAKALIPHYYLTIDCNLTALMAVREALNAAAPKNKEKQPAYKLSVNDFVVKASAMALIRHPDVNASWTETSIIKHKHADVGIAVAIPSGLITPIVFAAESKGLAQISNEVKDLAGKAKDKKLKPNEYEGGSFSVSNLGMFGIKSFTVDHQPAPVLHHRGWRGRRARHCRERQDRGRHHDDGDHVLRSPRGGRRHRREIPANLQAVHRRTCFDAALSAGAHGR